MSENTDQKRVLKFNSLQEFNAVSSTLEYPGLFMIADKSNNNVDGQSINKTARRAAISAIANAEFGDFLLENKSTNKPLVVPVDSYDTETYPTDTYDVIAICIFDAASRPDNKCVFMALKMMDASNPENGVRTYNAERPNSQKLYWGPNQETGIPGIKTSTDSLYINEEIKKLVTVDWSGSTIPNVKNAEGSYPAFECCWRYHTLTTNPGDWVLGCLYDFSKKTNNQLLIYQNLQKINIPNVPCMTCTEVNMYKYRDDGNNDDISKTIDMDMVIPVYIVQPD